MPVCLARIDDRLVHGQVVEGWIPHLRAERVVVVSDAAAHDETQLALMRMALPDDIDFEALSVDEAARNPAVLESDGKRTLLLAPGPLEILGLLERGVNLARVNVGGLHYSAGKVQLGKAIFLSEEDRRALQRISRRGVVLEGRATPADREVDLLALLEDQGAAS